MTKKVELNEAMLDEVLGGFKLDEVNKTLKAGNGSGPIYRYNNRDDVIRVAMQVLTPGESVDSFDSKAIPALLKAGVIYE